jgi:hypothetical protein
MLEGGANDKRFYCNTASAHQKFNTKTNRTTRKHMKSYLQV